ncbi:hypothetical protein CHS0354_016617 [Potamilus streckersoni]|uniref:Uncharacterized protein n=1 Tax=Potamilus streckersoni TaxID=2493646 RepID=A0AAE0WEI0_9BIVA|nr:hypothetical protein CHS0354_016617 [Potamilus streckersoni]
MDGNLTVDNLIKMFLGNANFAGAVIACFLDNTVPGTAEERGITAWYRQKGSNYDEKTYLEGMEIYNPWLPKSIRSSRILKFIPFLPDPEITYTVNKEDGRKEETELL